jgi:uncharacterized protein
MIFAKIFTTIFPLLLFSSIAFAAPVKVLIIDGQNNHAWKETTPVLKRLLEEAKFRVDVSTAPAKGGDMSLFRPNFAAYDLVVSNYNGESWSAETKANFEKFVAGGGGFVSYHAADNSFPDWKAYSEMTAVGGWEKRSVGISGSRIRFRDGKVVTENQVLSGPARCGNHGARLAFQVVMRQPKHPIAKGLPTVWLHNDDELYDSLCGPAKDFELIATAHSEVSNRGTGEEEPMMLTTRFGKGRIFHTTLGHDVKAMQCVGFIVTLQRGAEWAATGKVTQKVPKDFPTATKISVR